MFPMRVALVGISVSALGGLVGYHAVHALRCGVADAGAVRYVRSTQPVMFWITVGAQIMFTFACGYLLLREIF